MDTTCCSVCWVWQRWLRRTSSNTSPRSKDGENILSSDHRTNDECIERIGTTQEDIQWRLGSKSYSGHQYIWKHLETNPLSFNFYTHEKSLVLHLHSTLERINDEIKRYAFQQKITSRMSWEINKRNKIRIMQEKQEGGKIRERKTFFRKLGEFSSLSFKKKKEFLLEKIMTWKKPWINHVTCHSNSHEGRERTEQKSKYRTGNKEEDGEKNSIPLFSCQVFELIAEVA